MKIFFRSWRGINIIHDHAKYLCGRKDLCAGVAFVCSILIFVLSHLISVLIFVLVDRKFQELIAVCSLFKNTSHIAMLPSCMLNNCIKVRAVKHGSIRKKLMLLERVVLCEVLANSCREYVPFFVYLRPVIFSAHSDPGGD